MRKLVEMWKGAPSVARSAAGYLFRGVSPLLFPTGKRVALDDVAFRVGVGSLGAYRRAAEFAHREGRFTTEFLSDARKAPVVYDIGAHVGYYVLLAAKANPDARIVAFEPQRANYAELERNLARNGIENVSPFRCGVSDSDGHAHLDVVGSNARSGGGTHHLSSDGAGEDVTIVALDAFVADRKLPPPSVVLMDIEGHELAALKGMAGLLATHKPTLYVEVHRRQLESRGESVQQLDEFLDRFGYRPEILRSPTGERGTHSQLHVRYRVPEKERS